jgi:hypothetical protein
MLCQTGMFCGSRLTLEMAVEQAEACGFYGAWPNEKPATPPLKH